MRRFVLRDSIVTLGRSFCAFFSSPEIPFPGNGDRERLVLPRQLRGHVRELRYSQAMRQPPRDGRFHEIGRQESKRDGHVDLPNAAPLALSDAFRICTRLGKTFAEPSGGLAQSMRPGARGTPSGSDERPAVKAPGQKNLPAPC
jgi:hypothetical protein